MQHLGFFLVTLWGHISLGLAAMTTGGHGNVGTKTSVRCWATSASDTILPRQLHDSGHRHLLLAGGQAPFACNHPMSGPGAQWRRQRAHELTRRSNATSCMTCRVEVTQKLRNPGGVVCATCRGHTQSGSGAKPHAPAAGTSSNVPSHRR